MQLTNKQVMNALLFTKLSSIFACFISCGWVIKIAAYIEITGISE